VLMEISNNKKMKKLNWIKIEELIEQKYITKRKHPTEDIWVLNYTNKCQFDKNWCDETEICRGLIVDKDNNILARPFRKFFNYEEDIEVKLPDGDFKIYEKQDGSLGIFFFYNGKWILSTRGSFESEQAKKGTEMFQKELDKFSSLDKTKTYIFEIIYPENKIIVDYEKKEMLILLAVIDTKTGEELEIDKFDFDYTKEVKGVKDFTTLTNIPKDNSEGFVIKWSNGFRLKMKYAEYTRLHKLLSGINERRIWDILRNGESLDEILDRVPDEFYNWTKEVKEKIEKRFCNLRDKAKDVKRDAEKLSTRKEQALFILKNKEGKMLAGAVFKMLDNKDWKDDIWKLIKPKSEKSFKVIE